MLAAASANRSLLDYCLPRKMAGNGDALVHWSPFTSGCDLAHDCYCYHVTGDMSRARNPTGWQQYATKSVLSRGSRDDGKRCRCLSGSPCLFSDMRPIKILAAITAARLAGVTHIIEEGRFGGLSAAMYSLHGFHVTSVEFLPLSGSTTGLTWWNSLHIGPPVTMLNGDGSKLVPMLVDRMSRKQAAATMVIFDGEKRFDAYRTYAKVKPHIALAIFDDTNVADGDSFKRSLHAREIWWDTEDVTWSRFESRERPALRQLKPLNNFTRTMKWFGGINELSKFHFTIVAGGAWGGTLSLSDRLARIGRAVVG